jgi:hypothetical protein
MEIPNTTKVLVGDTFTFYSHANLLTAYHSTTKHTRACQSINVKEYFPLNKGKICLNFPMADNIKLTQYSSGAG